MYRDYAYSELNSLRSRAKHCEEAIKRDRKDLALQLIREIDADLARIATYVACLKVGNVRSLHSKI